MLTHTNTLHTNINSDHVCVRGVHAACVTHNDQFSREGGWKRRREGEGEGEGEG